MAVSGIGVMFTADGKASPLLVSQWRRKGAAVPLQVSDELLEQDLSATRAFRARWKIAFPSLPPLPFGAVATPDGRFTDPMVSIWLR